MKIISGGQTGVDRAALDVAIAHGIAYGGWCPKGGWAEDLTEPPGLLARYPNLKATPLADPAQRTAWNVRDADACLILCFGGGLRVSKGTALACELGKRDRKPLLVVDISLVDISLADALARGGAWLAGLLTTFSDLSLAIGGPRESEAPGVYAAAYAFTTALVRDVQHGRLPSTDR